MVISSIITGFFFLYGLILGSFFNVVGLRMPNGESIVRPRSYCPHCRRMLAARDLVPILSYMWNRGHCRYCGNPIPPGYSVMEFITGLLFAATYQAFGLTPETGMVLLFISVLVIVTVSDLAYFLILDKITFPAFFAILILRFFIHPNESYASHLIGAGLGFGIFYIIAMFARGGFGFGDVKLFAVVGLFLGWPRLLVVIMLSTCLGTLFGLLMIIAGRAKEGRKTAIPFGPFIALGSVLAVFFGYDLIDWYWGLFW